MQGGSGLNRSIYKSQFQNDKILGSSINNLAAEKRKPTGLNVAFNPADYKTVGVTERDVELYKEVFDLFDTNENGILTPSDLRNAFEMFGYHPKRPVVYQMISDYDANEGGGIGFKEFLKIMTDQLRPCDEDKEEEYDRAFNNIDIDAKGYITKEDIQRMCLDIGEEMTDDELNEVMKKFDPENGEKCTLKSFYKCMVEATARKPKKK